MKAWTPVRADLALTPIWLVLLVVYAGSSLWTIALSLTSSRSLPSYHFIGFDQYARLWLNARWPAALEHMIVFGAGLLAATLALSILLAIALDRAPRGQGLFRTIFIYPAAVSFVVTGLAFRWMLDPVFGVQSLLDNLGVDSFRLDWASHPQTVLLALIAAGTWQGAGLATMIILASLRSVGQEIWNAARVDGVPVWRIYASILLPMSWPAILTASLILVVNAARVYDLVVAFTHGGPGTSSDMPALYIMDYLFLRQNLALACAASVSLLALIGIAGLAIGMLQRRFERVAAP